MFPGCSAVLPELRRKRRRRWPEFSGLSTRKEKATERETEMLWRYEEGIFKSLAEYWSVYVCEENSEALESVERLR